jgi:hypothetical protein
MWRNRGLTLLPSKPLVRDIGNDGSGTHMKKESLPEDELATAPLHAPVREPVIEEGVLRAFEKAIRGTWLHRLRQKLRN